MCSLLQYGWNTTPISSFTCCCSRMHYIGTTSSDRWSQRVKCKACHLFKISGRLHLQQIPTQVTDFQTEKNSVVRVREKSISYRFFKYYYFLLLTGNISCKSACITMIVLYLLSFVVMLAQFEWTAGFRIQEDCCTRKVWSFKGAVLDAKKSSAWFTSRNFSRSF